MDLTGKVAFITGSAGGIGKGLANALLEKGVKVYLIDINSELGDATLKEFQTKYGKDRVTFSVLDVTKEKDFQEVFDNAVKTFGRVDIMINNAGIINECYPDKSLMVNVGGVMRGTKIATEHMRTGNNGVGGRVITVCSVHGFEQVYAMPAYTATKHAVRAFITCMSLQEDKKKQGVQYAALCPDTMEVGMSMKPFDPKLYPTEYWDLFRQALSAPKTIPISKLTEAMMTLLSLEDMSGAMLAVCLEGSRYRKMYYESSPSFIPNDAAPGLGVEIDPEKIAKKE